MYKSIIQFDSGAGKMDSHCFVGHLVSYLFYDMFISSFQILKELEPYMHRGGMDGGDSHHIGGMGGDPHLMF